MAAHAACLCVNVHSEEWGSMAVPAKREDRVKQIGEHVRAQTRVPVQDQVLLLGLQPLKPHRTLSSYGIDHGTTIHLTLRVVEPSDEELPLVLVEPGDEGQRHVLRARRSSSVAQVREMIQTKTAVPPRADCDLQWKEAGRREDHGTLWHQEGHLTLLDTPLHRGVTILGRDDSRSKRELISS